MAGGPKHLNIGACGDISVQTMGRRMGDSEDPGSLRVPTSAWMDGLGDLEEPIFCLLCAACGSKAGPSAAGVSGEGQGPLCLCVCVNVNSPITVTLDLDKAIALFISLP